MKRLALQYCTLLLLLLLSSKGYGGVEPAISAPLDGVFFIQSAANPKYIANATFSNGLADFNSNTSTYSFPSDQQFRKIDNMLELYLDPDYVIQIDFPYTLVVLVDILKYEYGASAPSTDVATLEISYDPVDRTHWVEKANYHFVNAGRVDYTINTVTLTSPNTLSEGQKNAVALVVGLRSDIVIERYFDFDVNPGVIGKNLWSVYQPASNELMIKWNVIPGAEYYDLEWTYVDDYDGQGGKKPANQLGLNKHYNLVRSASRVRVAEQQYTFPLVFERGYILYRLRGIGMEYDATTDQVYTMPGRWSNPVNNLPFGPEQALDVDKWVHKYAISTAYEQDRLNWQITTSYAEEGKRKDIIGFRDGTQRNRQTITGLSTDHLAMVAENIFDHQGRSAIQVLPVPANGPTLKYYQHFNRDLNGNPYSRINFDTTRANCNLSADPMGTTSGAAQYYSPNNPVKINENAYLPDANGFPFIQTEFTPDNTGRIRGQSGVGLHHKLGSKHETQYFYGPPAQEEISRLFGVEVGHADHYKKNVVQDPNGQLSVSFLDLKGKVIATALAGNPPKNVDQLDSYHPYPMDIDLMVFNQKDSLANELIATHSLTVTTRSDYNFTYTVSNAAFTAALCDGIQLCYDCVYDLEIMVIDNYSCDSIWFQTVKKINPLQFNSDGEIVVDDACPKPATYYALNSTSAPKSFVIKDLDVGSYSVIKKLKVNQAATDAYVKHYLDRFATECKSVYDDILQSYLSEVDSTMCDLADDEQALNRCEVAREGMLADLSPGGQYGLINWSNYTATDPLSVFNTSTSNKLPQTGANWQNPTKPYLNENGKRDSFYNSANVLIAPEKAGSLQEFLGNWQPSWAESLLPYHPEYCYLQWCEADNPSFDFDVELAGVTTYQDALAKGYLDFSISPPLSILGKDPYFVTTGGGVASIKGLMINAINVYYFNTAKNIPVHSMLEMAVLTELLKTQPATTLANAKSWITSHSPNPAVEDSVWFHFRALYLSKKEAFQYADRTKYAIDCPNNTNKNPNNGGYNECIGANPFLWQKNQFTLGGFPNAPFFKLPAQACGWSTFHLYKDKGIRFPSVYNIPVDFDPYGDPDEALQDFAGWADQLTGINCDSCDCSNLAINQLVNWVLRQNNTTPPEKLISLGTYPFGAVLQQKLSSCLNAPVGQVKFRIDNNLQRLTIYLVNNLGTDSLSIELLSSTQNAWEIADTITCIKYLGQDSIGNILGEATLSYSQFAPYSPVSITIRPGCPSWEDWKFCEQNSQVHACPPTENALHLSQLLNSLISRNLLKTTFVINNNVNPDFLAFFNSPSTPLASVTWKGQQTGNTLKATLAGNQANCTFTLDLPAGLNVATLGHVLAFTPEYGQADPSTGYTYRALLRVALLNGGTPVTIRITSSCFPLSYCLKCPPVVGTNPTNLAPITPGQNKAPRNRRQRTPDPVTAQDQLGTELVRDPSQPCHGCDALDFSLDYDAAVSESSSMMVHVRPPADKCDPCTWPTDTLPTIPIPNPCIEEQIVAAYANASNAYEQYLDSLTSELRRGYIRHCLNATETFSVKYTDALHHFTLYYYDQSNNLLKTIPPNGVVPLTPAVTKLAIQEMKAPTGHPIIPQHGMASDYTFNSLNQLRKQTIPDHDGESVFYYDYLSRIVVSQNPEQRLNKRYSYSLYDALNRPYEVGELTSVPTLMTDALAKNETQLLNWINNTKSGQQKREVTTTQYDTPLPGVSNQFFNGADGHYRSRVASVSYRELGGSPVQHTTYYRYDIHGNVEELVQDIHLLGTKKMSYDFDLISGNVKKVYYQKGEVDQFLHWYEYDADNRITTVRTSFDGLVWDTDAKYHYYRHGPLASTQLGEHKVQSVDFAYTIQGWIKGVNSGTLNAQTDMGQDGVAGHPHHRVARDAFGYILRYFTDDYQMIGSAPGGQGWEPAYQGTAFHRSNRDLYNGNIQSMITAIGEPVGSNLNLKALGYGYTYDQLNRITSMQAFGGLNAQTNSWAGATALNDYATRYTYDPNGNLDTLQRAGTTQAGAPLAMDDFKYHYTPGRNRLEYVTDKVSVSNYPEDIDDQLPGNYQYDAIGNLISDQSENLTISWNVAGKVKSIQKTATNELIEFSYDPTGKRVMKRLTHTATQKVVTTYYVLDATGNVMATYTNTETGPLKNRLPVWESAYVYGSSRLGEERIATNLADLKTLQNKQGNTWYSYRSRGRKYFELGNHLGNVLATVSDRKFPVFDGSNTATSYYYRPDIWTVSDYYPFGSPMPERSFADGGYRFGFNGKEKDDEVKGSGNYQDYGMRAYDGRLARFFSVDPITSDYPELSTYQFASNRPIDGVDLDGLEHESYVIVMSKEKGIEIADASKTIHDVRPHGWGRAITYKNKKGETVGYKFIPSLPPTVWTGPNRPLYINGVKVLGKWNDWEGEDQGTVTWERGKVIMAGTVGVILSGGTLLLAEGAAVGGAAAFGKGLTWFNLGTSIDDILSDDQGNSLLEQNMSPKMKAAYKSVKVAAALYNSNPISMMKSLKGGATKAEKLIGFTDFLKTYYDMVDGVFQLKENYSGMGKKEE